MKRFLLRIKLFFSDETKRNYDRSNRQIDIKHKEAIKLIREIWDKCIELTKKTLKEKP